MAVGKGDAAPDFTLSGMQDGERKDYSLAEFRGKPVVLVFYPGDNTPVCTRQLNTYTADVDEFAALGAQLLGISPQSVDSHCGFADKQGGFAFPLLADEDKAVGKAYGILGPVGFYRRSVFVIDAQRDDHLCPPSLRRCHLPAHRDAREGRRRRLLNCRATPSARRCHPTGDQRQVEVGADARARRRRRRGSRSRSAWRWRRCRRCGRRRPRATPGGCRGTTRRAGGSPSIVDLEALALGPNVHAGSRCSSPMSQLTARGDDGLAVDGAVPREPLGGDRARLEDADRRLDRCGRDGHLVVGALLGIEGRSRARRRPCRSTGRSRRRGATPMRARSPPPRASCRTS